VTHHVRTSRIPTPVEVADTLQEVANQFNLGNDARAQHLLDLLIVTIEDQAVHAGSAFLVEHLNVLSNQMNANSDDFNPTVTEMIKSLRSGLV
jgi:hypothetical protein